MSQEETQTTVDEKTGENAEDQARPSGVDFAGGNEEPGSEPATGDAQGETAENAAEENPLDKAAREIAELKDAWTRERAEFMNYKKRIVQEQARLRVMSQADLVSNLLPVLDNLETVLKAKTENPEVKNFVIGVEMIHKEFISVLDRHKIKTLRPDGMPFDPEFMEGISTDIQVDTVLETYQDGFYIEQEEGVKKVLRPARVKVGKPAAGAGSAGGEDASGLGGGEGVQA